MQTSSMLSFLHVTVVGRVSGADQAGAKRVRSASISVVFCDQIANATPSRELLSAESQISTFRITKLEFVLDQLTPRFRRLQ